jgi:hypothetical protein
MWLAQLWPHDMLLDEWPTFCGPGNSLGDWTIPDEIHGVKVCATCFIHDCMWSTSIDSYASFQAANNVFLKNLLSTVKSQLSGIKRQLAYVRCLLYFAAVSTVGMIHFCPFCRNPYSNPEIREKLNRLAKAQMVDKCNQDNQKK